jgi:hypothetical protein
MRVGEKGYLHRTARSFGKLPEALLHDPNISDGAKVLYAHMHWRYGSNGQNFEGQRSMAEMLGVKSRETIRKRIEELERADWIVVIRRHKERGQYVTNFYHVFESQEDCRAWKARHAQDSGHGHAQDSGHGHAQDSGHYLDSGYLDSGYLDTEESARADARADAPAPNRDTVDIQERAVRQKTASEQAKRSKRADSDGKGVARERPRDPLFDALAECAFRIPPAASIGRSTGARIGKVKAELLAAFPDAPPEASEVRAAYAWWSRTKKLAAPRDPAAVIAMLGEYRERGITRYGGKAGTAAADDRDARGGNPGARATDGGGDGPDGGGATFYDDDEPLEAGCPGAE